MYTCDLGRMADKITTMSKYGDAGHGGITRYSLSPEALQARGEFVKRIERRSEPRLKQMIWQISMQH